MPGHYVVRDRRHPDTVLDAFGAGRHLDEAACRQVFAPTIGALASFAPSSFAPSGHRATAARMLANLDRAFRLRRDNAAEFAQAASVQHQTQRQPGTL